MAHDQNAASPHNDSSDEPSSEVSSSPEAALDDDINYESFSDDMDPVQNTDQNNTETAESLRIKALENELARMKDHMMRAMAEAENARKRAAKDREDASKYAVSKFSKDLLSVADNLRRAIDSVTEELLGANPQVKSLLDGVEATERELLRSFEKNGLQKIEPLDQVFDPNFHEVMFEAPVPEKANGIIIQVIEPGYTLNGRILRPARVGIAKNNGAEQSSPPSSAQEPGQNLDTEA